MHIISLSQGWQLKQRSASLPVADDFGTSDHWLAATVPGCVHQDLLAARQISDPFYGLNENDIQWVGDADWLYRTTFDVAPELLEADLIALCSDGLDTFATVWLNGTQILSSDNMFLPHRVQVKHLLRTEQNELHILFESAMRKGKEREAQYGALPLWNGDSSRLYVRKAQYHYGWDWGPILMTAGPWRALRLEAYNARIEDLHCPYEIDASLQHATLPINITLEESSTATQAGLQVHLDLYAPTGELAASTTLPVQGKELRHTFELAQPHLWWPRGQGEQALYRLVATLQQNEQELDRQEQHLGLRRLRVVQQPLQDEPGQTFYFEVNNVPLFCGGANWIPADSFITAISPERYRHWVQLAADGNMQMLRVWGGGIYEEEVFYDSCDELGLLVWQDFMFGCGFYPVPEWFQESIRAEAIANVRRLRHHPSLALWSGNNEDYLIASSIRAYDSEEKGDFTQGKFPARVIYEQILPEVCSQFDPTRPYWPGSPYGGSDPNDLTEGDQHIWSIWHGMVPYQNYYKFAGRFVSEFGMQGMPAMATIESFTTVEERYPQSHTLDHHNKNQAGPAIVAGYLAENFRIPADLPHYVYITQLLQSEAVSYAIRDWRRRWAGEGRQYTAGALVWQLNDCWPVTSWAIIDYYLRPKPAYYTLSRELAPLALGLRRTTKEHVAAWACSTFHTALQAELELRFWTLDGTLVGEERRQVTLAPDQATEFGEFAAQFEQPTVVAIRLLKDGAVLARGTLWPEPFKYLTLPDPDLHIEYGEQDVVQLQVKRPAKGVFLTAGDGVQWSDNMLDLLPDDPQCVVARGLSGREIQAEWLGK